MSLPSSYLALTRKEQLYVDSRLSGLGKVASAAAAGYASPNNESARLEAKEHIQAALIAMTEKSAEEVGFSRKDAHDMYMDAYQNAETATEQIAAVNAMVKLHGLEAPKQVEVKHDHQVSGEIRYLPTEELMKLAEMENDLVLDGEYEEVGEKPLLEPPEVTDDNTESRKTLPDSPTGYRAL